MARKTDEATSKAREAIAAFVDGNAPKLQEWLDDIANGKKNEGGMWLTRPDPEKAFRLVIELMEYHLPKLARTEVVARISRATEMTEEALERIATGSRGGVAETSASSQKPGAVH